MNQYSYAQHTVTPSNLPHPEQSSILDGVQKINNKNLEGLSPRVRKLIEAVFDKQYDQLTHDLEHGAYLYDSTLVEYVHQIVDTIYKYNPSIPKEDLRFLIAASPWPNAAAHANGNIEINIGLFRKIENESQLAFVICHEIAHYMLEHSITRMVTHFELISSKAFKKEIRTISKQEFNKTSQLNALLKQMVYGSRKHSRGNEHQADSLGLILFERTPYATTEAVSCINLLDTIDYYKYGVDLDLHRVFDFQNYAFKAEWLEKEDYIFGGPLELKEYYHIDSMKTHPDCADRSHVLAAMVQGNPSTNKYHNLQDTSLLRVIIQQCDYAFLASWEQQENYGRGLFHALQFLQDHPQDIYAKVMVGAMLQKIHFQSVNHQISRYMERPNSKQEAEYSQFLVLMDNLRFSELSQIGYFFHLQQVEHCLHNEDFLYNLIYFCEQVGDKDNMYKYCDLYKEQYPKGKYIDSIFKF